MIGDFHSKDVPIFARVEGFVAFLTPVVTADVVVCHLLLTLSAPHYERK